MQSLIIILSPFIPHLAEESWSQLGFKGLACKQSWPEFEENLIKDKNAKLIVQINGKKRGEISIPIETEEEGAIEAAQNNKKIKGDLAEKEIKKVIYVKGRILNFVI